MKEPDFESIASDISGIHPETLKSVAKHIEEEVTVQDLTVEERKVFALHEKVKTIPSKIMGSEASKILYWNEIKAYCSHFAILHIFFMANPSPQNSPLFQLMCGDTSINLDEHFPEMVDYMKCCIRLANNPVAALHFFNFSCKVMIQFLFDWDFKKGCLSREGGIISHLKAFYGMNELTERGSYHVHFLLILRGGLNPSDLH